MVKEDMLNIAEKIGVDPSKINGPNDLDEEYNEEDYSQEVDETQDVTPEDTMDAKELEEETKEDYTEQEKIVNEYQRLRKKIADKEELTPEELAWKNEIEKLYMEEQSAEEKQEEQAATEKKRQEEIKAEVIREYNETKAKNPEKILKTTEQEAILTGSESLPKILSLVFKLKKARKKGGKILIQVFRNRKVILKWTRNDISFVEFWSKDENGNDLIEITRFSEYKYLFEGTPIPVLFAVQGYAEGFDFFSEFRKDLTSEVVSRLLMRSYIAGYVKGAEIKQDTKKKGMLEGLQPLMPVIIIGGFILLAYLIYMMYGEMQDMIEAMNALKTQLEVTRAVAQVVMP